MTRSTSPRPEAARWETPFALALLLAALAFAGWGLSTGWSEGLLPGNEFRQTQTALSTLFIHREGNFSPAYPTPVLGKPWSIPMEFPLYQWSVVGLARATGWPLVVAARAVSAACLLLVLPGLHGLLRRCGLPAAPRLYALAFAAACPLHLFYGRAFLIETMALLCAVWFLYSFVATLQERRAGWLALCLVTGVAAALVKVTTFLVYLLPAAIWGAVLLHRAWRARGPSWRAPATTLAWGLGAAAPALLAGALWVGFADDVKRHNPCAGFLLSDHLAGFNFGSGLLAERVSTTVWTSLVQTWHRGLLPWPALALLAGAALCGGGRWRRAAAGAAALFLAAQATFPNLYSFHDYYHVAIGVILATAAAFALAGLRESARPRWTAPALAALCLGAQGWAYVTHYRPGQLVHSSGGSGLTDALRGLTPRESVIIVAGADWSSAIPYYAERRALALRRGTENDPALLEAALAGLADEEVAALVLVGDQRGNQALVERVAARFALDRSATYSHPTADVYVGRAYLATVVSWLNLPHGYDRITTTRRPAAAAEAGAAAPTPLTAQTARTLFEMVSPAPSQMRATYGFPILEVDGDRVLNTHPDSDLWVPPPAGATRIEWEFGLLPGAYTGAGGTTNGVDFIVDAELPDGTRRELFRRTLAPAEAAADRGLQTARIDFRTAPGEALVFRTRDHGHPGFDWAFWRRIAIK